MQNKLTILLTTSVVILIAMCSPRSAMAETSIDVEAKPDGLSDLLIKGNTVQWDHLQFSGPGKLDTGHSSGGYATGIAQHEPTIIRILEDGLEVKRIDWYPLWEDRYWDGWDPNEQYLPPEHLIDAGWGSPGSHWYSDVLQDPDIPNIGTSGIPWIGTQRFGRNTVTVIEQPSAENDYTLRVQFDDVTGENGVADAWHAITLTLVPEPASLVLLASGGLVLLSRRRRKGPN